ncbi:MAG: hypothetical protein AB7V16_01315 [Vulcanibacillus sp.]
MLIFTNSQKGVINIKLTKGLGTLLLAIWLIMTGLMQLFSISFPLSGTVMGVLALAAGVLMLLRR